MSGLPPGVREGYAFPAAVSSFIHSLSLILHPSSFCPASPLIEGHSPKPAKKVVANNNTLCYPRNGGSLAIQWTLYFSCFALKRTGVSAFRFALKNSGTWDKPRSKSDTDLVATRQWSRSRDTLPTGRVSAFAHHAPQSFTIHDLRFTIHYPPSQPSHTVSCGERAQ